jgi:hypothetical protein
VLVEIKGFHETAMHGKNRSHIVLGAGDPDVLRDPGIVRPQLLVVKRKLLEIAIVEGIAPAGPHLG